MIAPIPSIVRFHALRARLSVCVPSALASSWSAAMLFVDHNPIVESPGSAGMFLLGGGRLPKGGHMLRAGVIRDCIQSRKIPLRHFVVKQNNSSDGSAIVRAPLSL